MSPLSALPDPDAGQEAPQGEKPKPSSTRPRTLRPLPTDRIAFLKQLGLLRGFAVAAAEGDGHASANDAEKVVKMSHTTIALATPFFADSGLLTRSDRGRFKPSDEVNEYTKTFAFSPDTAGQYLRPVIARSWFGEIIASKVKLNPRDIDDVMAALAAASGATVEHKDQISVLIDYAALAGLARREGTILRRVDGSALSTPAEPEPVIETQPPALDTGRDGTRSGFVHDPTEGYVEFHVDVKVRTSEFQSWRPERIAAFFGGIAQVLAAKGGMEEDAAVNR